MSTPGLFYVVEKTWLLPTCADRFLQPKSEEKKHSKKQKNTKASRPVACASRFKQGYVAHVPCTRGYHVCLCLFERPGAPTSLTIKVNFIYIPTLQLLFIFAPVSVPSSFFARRLLAIMPPTLAVHKCLGVGHFISILSHLRQSMWYICSCQPGFMIEAYDDTVINKRQFIIVVAYLTICEHASVLSESRICE